MKKLYTFMAAAALCLPTTAKTFEQNAVDLTNCIITGYESTRPKDANWIVAMYFEGGYKFTKVETVNGELAFVQHGDLCTYDEATKKDTEQGTTNKKIKALFTSGAKNGINFTNIAMVDGIGEVTVPSKIYVDGTLTADAAKEGTVVFRYGFGTDLRLGLLSTEVNLNDLPGFEVGLELPDNNKVEVTYTTSVFNTEDGLGDIGHVAYFEMGNTASASSSNPNKVKLTNTTPLSGDKGFLSVVPEGKEWYHVPVKWLDIIVHNVKPGDTVGIYSLKTLDSDPTGVGEIVSENENAPVEYYNLQGIRVANPENGLYIKRQGSSVTKVLVK